ncbi:MAG: NUDIX hydrolase [Chloroflexota bacterium]|nr:MAG: NUDIX hydrolase [Chloroflexota bacterium]
MSRLSIPQKERLAQIVRVPLVSFLMNLAIKLVVARHRVGVTVVCFDRDERILLLRHVFHPFSRWDLPGGWLDRHESPADCALRELSEETELTARLGPVIHVTREPVPAGIGITYLARLSSEGKEPRLSSEILEAAWFAPGELPGGLRPITRAIIEAAVQQLSFWLTTEQTPDV